MPGTILSRSPRQIFERVRRTTSRSARWLVWLLVLLIAVVSEVTVPAMSQDRQAQPANSPAALRAAELLSQAIALYRAGKVADADTAYKIALKAAEELNDPRDSAAIVKVLGWQAGFYRQQLRLAEAWSAAERALALHEPVFGPDDVHTAYLHTLLGMIASQQREYSKAEPHLRAVLDAYSRNGGSKQRDGNAANAAQELGTVFRAQKRFAEAVTVFRVAAALRGQAVPRDPVAIARNMYLLAAVFELARFPMGKSRYAEAEALLHRSIALREKTVPLDEFALAQALQRLGTVYQMQYRFALAEPLFRRGLEIVRRVKGPEQPEVATSFFLMGSLLFAAGRYSDAEGPFLSALTIRSKYDDLVAISEVEVHLAV